MVRGEGICTSGSLVPKQRILAKVLIFLIHFPMGAPDWVPQTSWSS
jgi:hypothetical protein